MMKKGLLTTLFAVAASFSGISSSYAAAPVVSALPDVRIGDAEDNAVTDNNYFVFTNAFRFDDYVSDADTTVSQLKWSFDEGDDPGQPVGTGTSWFRINNIAPIHVGGTAQSVDAGGATAHLNPGAFDIRAASDYATFRDIVFTPGSGLVGSGTVNPGGRFPTPAEPDKSAHAAGKIVTFFVSDGSAVASDSIIVSTVDNATDQVSAVGYNPQITNQFTGGVENWYMISPNGANGVALGHDASRGALVMTVNATGFVNRINGWTDLASGTGNATTDAEVPNDMPYSAAGAGNFVRAKFHVYAFGQSSPTQIPTFRIRVAYRFAITSILDIYHHLTYDTRPAAAARNLISQEMRPTSDPANPSVYRVDMDPPEIPLFVNEGTTQGLQRSIETFAPSNEPQEIGSLALTESSIGVYPALDVTTNNASVLAETYVGDDFTISDSQAGGTVYGQGLVYERGDANGNGVFFDLVAQSINGVDPNVNDAIPAATNVVFLGGTALSLSTAASPDNVIAIAAADFLGGASEDTGTSGNMNRLRIAENEQYVARFHASSTTAASNQAGIRFRMRTISFQYTQRLEVGGAWATGSSGNPLLRTLTDNNRAAQQYLPGAGTANASGNYDVIMISPMVSDIRNDAPSSATLADRMPLLSAEPGQGDNAASNRDIFPALDILDSLSGVYFATGTSDPAEKGQVTVDRIDIRRYPLAAD